ncbi:hypothetical protein, partial [Candidatus Glomeribacter gigasporarum]|uniref:hypothetical protein n=1 Tax=Candidatus Glomeribacter gigasporarum TaxID=132144 RepID=UPI001315A46E
MFTSMFYINPNIPQETEYAYLNSAESQGHQNSIRGPQGVTGPIQSDVSPIPFNNIEALVDRMNGISQACKNALKRKFPSMKLYDCKSLNDSLDQVAENIRLKERYLKAPIYSRRDQTYFKYSPDKVGQYFQTGRIQNSIKEELQWVPRVFNLLLDNPRVQRMDEGAGNDYGRVAYCCLAKLLSDINTWSGGRLQTEVRNFCEKAYPKNSDGSPLSDSDIQSLKFTHGQCKFSINRKAADTSLVHMPVDDALNREAADFVNFVIYRTEKLRIRLAGYVNVSKLIPKEPENEHGLIDTSFGPVQEEISSRDTDQYDTTDDTITVKG